MKKAGDIGECFLVGDIVYCDYLDRFGRVMSDATSFGSQYYDLDLPIFVQFAKDEHGCKVIRNYRRNGLRYDQQSSHSIIFFGRIGVNLLS
jgi:hypothetical protein